MGGVKWLPMQRCLMPDCLVVLESVGISCNWAQNLLIAVNHSSFYWFWTISCTHRLRISFGHLVTNRGLRARFRSADSVIIFTLQQFLAKLLSRALLNVQYLPWCEPWWFQLGPATVRPRCWLMLAASRASWQSKKWFYCLNSKFDFKFLDSPCRRRPPLPHCILAELLRWCHVHWPRWSLLSG